MANDKQRDRDPGDYVPMTPVEFMVLLVLTDGASHGYAIVKEIEARSNGDVSLLPGNLYAILQRLSATGLIARAAAGASRPEAGAGRAGTETSRGPDKRRRNYKITVLGRKVAAAEAARMKRLVEAAAARDLIEDVTS